MKKNLWKKNLFFAPILVIGVFFLWKNNPPKNLPASLDKAGVKERVFSNLSNSEKMLLETPELETFTIEKTVFPENICDISAYGAVSDGKTKNTESFRRAIEDCAQKGGGKVFVPEGVWLTGQIHLESGINLNLDEKAEIVFSQDFEDYLPLVFTRFEGVEIYNFSPPIYAKDKTDLAITGKGKINGRSKDFWWKTNKNYETLLNLEKIYQIAREAPPLEERVFGKKEDGIRPNFIQFINCDRILVEGVEIIDGPMWTIHPVYSQNIIIRDISVRTHKGKNTDGVVIDSSKNILIENSFFSTGDDSIAIKSGRDEDGRRTGKISENVVARNIRVEETHSAMAIGSEVSGGIKNVYGSDFLVKKSDFGLRIKSSPTRGSFIENVTLENFEIEFSEIAGFEIDLNYGRNPEAEPLSEDNPTDLKNIKIKNFSSQKSRYPFYIRGHENEPLEEIYFENIKINSKNDARVWNSQNIYFENLDIYSNEDKLPKIRMRKSRQIEIKKSPLDQGRIICEKEPCEFFLD